MASKELPASGDEYIHDEEETMECAGLQTRGGWTTFPFITVSALGLSIASAGWTTNLIVYLIQKFNIKNIHATEISNVVNGCTSFFPIVGAIIADSFMGNFFVILGSSILSLLGLVLLTLTATLDSLRPKDCKEDLETCEASSQFQLAILFSAITLVSIGMGGTRFTLATMGADQFDKIKDQGKFFNWYFFTFYLATIIGITVIVYVEDNVSWGLGYILCLAVNAIGVAIFICGKRYYRHIKPSGSPFTSIARVIVATIRKKKVLLSSASKDYYYGDIKGTLFPAVLVPTSRF
ncbi:NRT1/ PTR FAMILY 2.7-like, partial [Thalictrum thalictroides]